MATSENPYAGQGAVLLDIGGDVGALIVAMPPSTEGLEVEIRPAGATAGLHRHHHGHDQEHGHEHEHHGDHGHAHGPDGTAYPHVAVVARPTGAGTAYSLVYPSLSEGRYELCPLPLGEVALTVAVAGGSVTQAAWPS
ncbi:MAG TPA: hypothetical protein VFJ94_06520 [Intrasporangium sp.]|uniref:hypothetical protein n=1 Tax=Intrasporangium sp. TaxID=1925024 RepID=UPI002D76A109|nr:hypothetical protein [Intrasporangium sp.]HET7398158.1 hypothetical protein [Intrasporangium sp.]